MNIKLLGCELGRWDGWIGRELGHWTRGKCGGCAWDVQYKSPSSSSLFSPFSPALSNRPHSHSGYSSSSFATGPSLPFTYPRPFSTVPALTELRGAAASGAVVLALLGIGAVRGVENGCAAEVEVAAGGPSCEVLGGPRGEVCVLWSGVVERRRAVVERGRRERGEEVVVRRCKQRGQIMMGGGVEGWAAGSWWWWMGRAGVGLIWASKFWDCARLDLGLCSTARLPTNRECVERLFGCIDAGGHWFLRPSLRNVAFVDDSSGGFPAGSSLSCPCTSSMPNTFPNCQQVLIDGFNDERSL